MKVFKYEDVKMFFIPLVGALVSGKKQEISQTQRAIIILAGPIPGIIIGIVLLVYLLLYENYDLLIAANIFLLINLFNLLPINPLDGGKLIETLFFNSSEKLQLLFTLLSIIGAPFLAYFLESYFLLIIPLFLIFRYFRQSNLIKTKKFLDLKNLNYNQSYEQMSNQEYWLIRKEIISNFRIFSKIDKHKYEAVQEEDLIITTMKSLAGEQLKNDMSIGVKIIFTLIWIIFGISPLIYLLISGFGQGF